MPSPAPTIRLRPTGATDDSPSRRSFLRYTGAGAALGSLWLAGCKKDDEPLARPTISAFTPISGMPGTVVTVTGSHFTGATAVQLGSLNTAFMVVNDTTITFTVPAGAASGTIAIGTPAGPASTVDPFTVTTTPPVVTTVNVGTGDAGVLNYAYALEQLEAAFYTTLRMGTYYTGLATGSAERLVLDDLYYHEVIHRDFFKTAITAAGATPIKALTTNFSTINFNDRTTVLGAAKAFEDLGVAAYNGAGQYIQSAQYLYLAGKIVSVEARHAALIRDLVSEGTFAGNDVMTITTASTSSVATNNAPANSSLERAMSPAEVVAIANTFLADGSKLDVSGIK